MDSVTIAGFSLGGQILGETAKWFTARSGLKLPVCHGLDPAGPLYDDCDNQIRLDADDCVIVQVCHSDAAEHSNAPIVSGVGTNRKSGLCDHWINCGYNQRKGCDLTATEYLTGSEGSPDFPITYANHQRSYDHVRCPLAYAMQAQYGCVYGVDCPGCATRKCPPDIISDEKIDFMIGNNCNTESDYYVNSNNSDFCSKL